MIKRIQRPYLLLLLVLISILYWVFLEVAYQQKWDHVLLGVVLEIISIPILLIPFIVFPVSLYNLIRNKQKRIVWLLPVLLSLAAAFVILKDFF